MANFPEMDNLFPECRSEGWPSGEVMDHDALAFRAHVGAFPKRQAVWRPELEDEPDKGLIVAVTAERQRK
ncbi:hypothetical protein JYP51_08525 [Ponticoccus gilvus]|nr:hypothetical protein [Enemella evansiae]